MTSINNYDKSGVLGGNYDSCVMDFEAAHQALLKEARNAGYREGFEAGRAYEREEAEGESYEKELSKLAKYASVMGETTTNITRESEAIEALNEAYQSGPVESAIKETRAFNQQARRDEIVEQAKKNVDIFLKRGTDDYPSFMFEAEFIVNKEKRTVVALIKGRNSRHVYTRGIAKCAPGDCFNVHIGMEIALRRALGLAVPDEYLNAPQPTEVRVGDVIGYEDCRDEVVRVSRSHIYVDSGALYLLDDLLDESDDFNPFRDPRIIDDSRETEVGE
ncbi:hypothetical protein KM908_14310 [Alkalihalobacillus clausii]|uniref:hypothetical protein n=1 Tax=Shouchella clausii TaxID=79880 RepID=UPI001C24EB64|nr:hypothetical protein [Shouchella clausii]MBU8597315.1 hypothetical protein [Shouchella clausii]